MSANAAGLQEVAEGVLAYLQPQSGWGWSNAGLVSGEGGSLLIDTLFDLGLTRRMLAAMTPVTRSRPIDALVNTHGNGDHCFGNALLPAGTTIYASSAAILDMKDTPPERLAALMRSDLGPLITPFLQRMFGAFEFAGIEQRLPDRSFSGALALDVTGRQVAVLELGPAHTRGDAVVHIPDAGVVFAGDLLFIGSTPLITSGPASNWIGACDRLLALGASTYVPGHGPITDADGVRAVQRYLRHVAREATARYRAGMPADEAALDIDLGEFADWTEPERIAVNVESVYRELDPARPAPGGVERFERMARWSRRHATAR
jgi:glyoxylase-like metal-dependent hydrolase (beta-lactamase superfamily II)